MCVGIYELHNIKSSSMCFDHTPNGFELIDLNMLHFSKSNHRTKLSFNRHSIIKFARQIRKIIVADVEKIVKKTE